MAVVVFSPEQATRSSRRRTGLVLGAGGVLGAAWMTGTLACLQDRLPYAAGDVDVIVGTSAGSVLAAALRCHASLDEMMAWQREQASGDLSESVVLAARDGPLPPLPRWRLGSIRAGVAPVTHAAPGTSVGGRESLAAARPGPARRAAVTGQRVAAAPSSAGLPRRAAT